MKLEEITNLKNEEVIDWMIDNGMLVKNMICKLCTKPQKLIHCERNVDKRMWRCFNTRCKKVNFYVSLRKDSFFEGTTKSLKTYLLVLFYWSKQLTQEEILKFVSIERSALKRFKNKLLNKIKTYFEKNPVVLGGPDRLVQIDETMLNHKVKAHRGRAPKEQLWALGIVDCSYKPARGFMCRIENKSCSIILPLIEKHVCRGSIIYTDEAKVYQSLKKNVNYEHKSIIHKYNFVNYENNVHTQNIESYNNKVKLRIKKMKGVKKEALDLFLCEFMWLDNFGGFCFEKTVELFSI